MEDVKRADDVAKWELIRRLRYGALLKLFRHRWGNELPDDDAGRVPWLTASHVILNKNQKPAGHVQHSPYLIGESDYGGKDVGFCLENWTVLGQVHKRRVREVNQEIVLKRPHKSVLHLKPDSRLVLLFWARHIIMMHYIRYWLPVEHRSKQAA
jgi:hypothetical protein